MVVVAPVWRFANVRESFRFRADTLGVGLFGKGFQIQQSTSWSFHDDLEGFEDDMGRGIHPLLGSAEGTARSRQYLNIKKQLYPLNGSQYHHMYRKNEK